MRYKRSEQAKEEISIEYARQAIAKRRPPRDKYIITVIIRVRPATKRCKNGNKLLYNLHYLIQDKIDSLSPILKKYKARVYVYPKLDDPQ